MPKILGKLPEDTKPGICLLIHGDTNSGKTHSAITGIPKILFLSKEPKDPRLVHSVIRPDYHEIIDYVEFDGFEDEIEFLNKLILKYGAGDRPYRTIFHDGLTFTMSFYKQAIEDDRFKAKELSKKEEDRPRPGLVDRVPMERKDWGTLAGLTARETRLLHELSKFGLMVVSTAISSEYPKWNNTIRVAPSLTGQEFPKLIHAWFDTIGYVIQPFHMLPDGKVSEPRISFISTDDGTGNSYMCRANPLLIRAEQKYGPLPLNLEKIAKIIRGEFKV